jgi:hypothetical protein
MLASAKQRTSRSDIRAGRTQRESTSSGPVSVLVPPSAHCCAALSGCYRDDPLSQAYQFSPRRAWRLISSEVSRRKGLLLMFRRRSVAASLWISGANISTKTNSADLCSWVHRADQL